MHTIRQYSSIPVSVAQELLDPTSNKHPNIYIGTGAYIGPNVKFHCHNIHIGDYTKIHDNTLIFGDKDFTIGHNCWVGGNVVLDTRGGLTIRNGVGIGAGSQLWTHSRFGDRLQGCMWDKEKEMVIEDDVWFVGHCLVSPIKADRGSMALLGSVVTKDMYSNCVYAGVPAKSINQYQFGYWTDDDRRHAQDKMFQKYCEEKTVRISTHFYDDFDPVKRTYKKRNTLEQHQFMKWAVPLYKYNPIEDEVLL